MSLFLTLVLASPAWTDEPEPTAKTTKVAKKKPKPARPVTPPKKPKPTPPPAAQPAPERPPRAAPPAQAAPGRPVKPARPAPTPAAVRSTAREAAPVHPHPVAPPVARGRPLHLTTDHRYARPDPFVVVSAAHPPPRYVWYRPCWTRWWVHPYWRWTHATTVVVWFDFTPDPWVEVWIPPPRPGWIWVAGTWGPYWVPGWWEPAAPPPTWFGVAWVWVPGFWMGTVWVEGFWRPADRPGWVWVEGWYLDDGTYVRGAWEPVEPAPRHGYVWESGFFDGQYWVEGFWRPAERAGYRWVSAWLDADGVFHAGYWEPLEARLGMVWIPGWFDGSGWIEGYWVPQEEADRADPATWQPEPGWDARAPTGAAPPLEELPPALPYGGPADPGGA